MASPAPAKVASAVVGEKIDPNAKRGNAVPLKRTGSDDASSDCSDISEYEELSKAYDRLLDEERRGSLSISLILSLSRSLFPS